MLAPMSYMGHIVAAVRRKLWDNLLRNIWQYVGWYTYRPNEDYCRAYLTILSH